MNRTESAKQGRPLEFDPDKALEKAMLLFWSRGYEATSTAELLKVMGLSKSSLYQAFGSKQQLFNRCLDAYASMTLEQMKGLFAQADSPKQFLLGLFYAVATHRPQKGEPLGCFLVNTACELGAKSDIAGPLLRGHSDRVLALFRAAAEEMRGKGEIAATIDPAGLAQQLHTCLCGMKVAEKLNYTEQQRLAAYHMVEKLLN